MYQPKNLRLVLVGEIDHAELLDILEDFEEGILDAIPSPDAPFKRPWVESTKAKPLEKTIVDTVEFPEDDESMGEITVAFFGPSCNDLVAGTYLSSVARKDTDNG
jgi:Zn-dependent M16 (insulinase) family peptidase